VVRRADSGKAKLKPTGDWNEHVDLNQPQISISPFSI